MAKWKDKIKASELYEADLFFGEFRLTIHRHVYHPPNVWLASCHGLFSQSVLKSIDPEDAKIEAVKLVRAVLEHALEDISE